MQALIDAWQEGKFEAEFVVVGSDYAEAQALKRAEKTKIPYRAFPKQDYSSRWEQEQAILAWLKGSQIELLVLAGFMRVLSAEFLKTLNCPVLNIHPSLLPSFPGLHAQRQAIEYGVKVSGCTVHFVDEGLDSGPIILQEAVPVEPGDTEETLSERILKVEHKLYPEAVRLITTGQVSIRR